MAPIQFDDTDGGGDEEHLTGGGAKPGEKNREERPGEVQMRRREQKGWEFCSFKYILTLLRESQGAMELLHKTLYKLQALFIKLDEVLFIYLHSGVWDVWHHRQY